MYDLEDHGKFIRSIASEARDLGFEMLTKELRYLAAWVDDMDAEPDEPDISENYAG